MQATDGQIVDAFDDVSIRHFRHRHVFLLDEAVEDQLGDAWDQRHVELAGRRFHPGDHLFQAGDFRLRRHADGQDRIGDLSNGQHVGFEVVGQFVVLERMHRERTGGSIHQHVIVIGTHESADRHKAIAAGPVLDNDRLAPTLLQPLGHQSGTDVSAGTTAEGNDEFDRALRPGGRLGSSRHEAHGGKAGQAGGKGKDAFCQARG